MKPLPFLKLPPHKSLHFLLKSGFHYVAVISFISLILTVAMSFIVPSGIEPWQKIAAWFAIWITYDLYPHRHKSRPF